jgi:hypothetical protein
MSTTRQMKPVLKAIGAANDDVLVSGRDIIIRPLNHIITGILTDHFLDSDSFRAFYWNILLFEPSKISGFDGSFSIRSPSGGAWSLKEQSASFVEMCTEKVLPQQRARNSIHVLRDHWRRLLTDGKRFQQANWKSDFAWASLAIGELDDALPHLNEDQSWNAPYHVRAMLNAESPGLGDRLAEQGNALGAKDRAALAAILHKWEEYTVTNLKLTKYWEPSPFPLEMM